MISITTAASTEIAKQYGIQPILVIEVQWDSVITKRYAAQAIFSAEPRLVQCSEIDYTNEDFLGTIESASATLSDNDGELKTLFTGRTLFGSPVKIYHFFNGLAEADKILIFTGVVTAPIKWSESERTLELSFISRLEDKIVSGPDQEELSNSDCPLEFPPISFGTVFGVKVTPQECIPQAWLLDEIYSQAFGKDTLNTANVVINKDSFRVWNGEKFPQGQRITLLIDNTLFVGAFSGNVFNCVAGGFNASFGNFQVQGRQSGSSDYDNPSAVFINNADSAWMAGKYAVMSFNQRYSYVGNKDNVVPTGMEGATTKTEKLYIVDQIGSTNGNVVYLAHSRPDLFGQPYCLGMQGDSAKCTQITGKYPMSVTGHSLNLTYDYPDRWSIAPQTAVVQLKEPHGYYANWLPSTILGVYGLRENKVCSIPQSMYTVTSTPHTIIQMKKTLSWYGGWDSDDIFVSLTSAVGPNIVDIVQWLVENYTPYSIDATSFAATKVLTSVANYPSCFTLTSAKSVNTILRDICQQAHLQITVTGGVVYIADLATCPSTSSYSLTDAKAEFGSYNLYTSDVNDLITKLVGRWCRTGFPVDVEQSITKYNNLKFSTYERYVDFYIYNIRQCVLKSMEFWLDRLSNIWYYLEAKTFLTSLPVQTGDRIGVINSFAPIDYGILRDYTLDPIEHSILLKAWLPFSNSGGQAWLTFDDSIAVDTSANQFDFSIVNVGFFQVLQQSGLGHAPKANQSQQDAALLDTFNAGVRAVKVVEIKDNYLVCSFIQSYDHKDPKDLTSDTIGYTKTNKKTEIPASVPVAMPSSFRRAMYDTGKAIDGITYTGYPYTSGTQHRKATDGSVTEEQYITPAYKKDDILQVMILPSGTGINDPDINKELGLVCWQDLNIDGRVWALKED